ncbi:MAG: HupE/UreJ family protein [Deltaproteobacteria bacterium]|nr:HupE/UreJ family protein [Deltaproteobacteria bacterium]
MRALLACLALLLSTLLPSRGSAHDFSPGVLSLRERSDGRYDVVWTPPVDARAGDALVEVVYPPPCSAQGGVVTCGPEGLAGDIAFRGLDGSRAPIVVTVRLRDGLRVEALATAASPSVRVQARGAGSVGRWLRTGVEHVLFGLDHVAFIVGLFLLVGARRKLVATITAFTVAHSITLALGATRLLALPRAPVEATIAASILLVSSEALRDRPTIARAHPSVIAFLFGLVHGLGFAGALADTGVGGGGLARALLSFNAGVELAQLAIVAVLLIASRAALSPARAAMARRVSCYALGASGGYWLVERTVDLLRA